MKVTDPSGIRRVEIVDVTGAPAVVGAEDYDADGGGVQTDRGASCNFRFASPCPQLSYGETLRATSLQAGRRKLIVRATDAGGNIVERGPYEVDVVSPSDRGALNGGNATETAVDLRPLHPRQQPHAPHDRLPHQGRRRRPAAQLRRASRSPAPASPCSRATSTTTTRSCAPTSRPTATAASATAPSAYASRLYQFAWASHVNDVRFAANGYVTLLARATASLTPSPRSVRVGQRVRLSGRLAGKRPRRSVDIVAQGRAGSRGSFRTFADGTIGRDGRFRVSYRFRDPASRGRTFQFRIKIERDSGFAYSGGYSRIAKVRVR